MDNTIKTPTIDELAERWCPLSVGLPKGDDNDIILFVPGALDPIRVRFGSIWWTEAGGVE